MNFCKSKYVVAVADIPHSFTDEALKEKDAGSLGGKKVQTHTFTDFPDHQESEEDDEDKSDVRNFD